MPRHCGRSVCSRQRTHDVARSTPATLSYCLCEQHEQGQRKLFLMLRKYRTPTPDDVVNGVVFCMSSLVRDAGFLVVRGL